MVEDGKVVLEKVDIYLTIVNILTKPINMNKFMLSIIPYTLSRDMTSERILGNVCHTP
jgi:hypothetical protein